MKVLYADIISAKKTTKDKSFKKHTRQQIQEFLSSIIHRVVVIFIRHEGDVSD